MNIQKLNLTHFRNYSAASFSFEPDAIHVLWGKNAQGKTNLLEAIYYLSHLRSWRTLKNASLPEHGQENFILECQVESKKRREVLKTVYSASKKHLYRNQKPVAAFSEFVGIVNAVLFCPDDLSLFSDPPKSRRQFIDMELVKLSHSYTATLSQFQKLLKERSAALKSWKPDKTMIEAITAQMIERQDVLIRQRDAFISSLEKAAGQFLPIFSDGKETLRIRYKTCVDPKEPVREQLEEQYRKTMDKDLMMKTTAVGIHKDDLEFYLDDRLITQTASQGQKRSVILALKLGLCEIIKEKSGQYPILLLDDVFSELDDSRRAALAEALPDEMQIFITTAETVSPAWFKKPVHFYTVDCGMMKEGIFDV